MTVGRLATIDYLRQRVRELRDCRPFTASGRVALASVIAELALDIQRLRDGTS